ncbi:MAG TPA: alpha/beta hydrolase [Burkholderiaceae bacterium]|nr:alpha/beta hydrolase [Burkholderiaceae bacterium]
MDRRTFIRSAAAASLAPVAVHGSAQASQRPFVLVAGAFSGGWIWARVAQRLRSAGHRVFTPTLTGLGERAHLMSASITMDTFVQDIVAVIDTEELKDVILVGSSFGGIPAGGAADVVANRISGLVFLDSVLGEPGKSAFDALPAEVVAARRKSAQETSGGVSLPPPPASAYGALGISEAPDIAWCQRRFTPHPIGSYESALTPRYGSNAVPKTYVACLNPGFGAIAPSRARARQQADWRWLEMNAGHLPMITAPDELTRLLIGLAR